MLPITARINKFRLNSLSKMDTFNPRFDIEKIFRQGKRKSSNCPNLRI